MQKIKFIPHLFLEILHVRESCNLIGQQHFVNRLRTGTDKGLRQNINNMFHSTLFKEKMMTKSFKNYKHTHTHTHTHTPYLDHFGSIFLIYGQNKIFIKILLFFFSILTKYLFF